MKRYRFTLPLSHISNILKIFLAFLAKNARLCYDEKKHRIEGKTMNIEFQDHFDPAYECIYLLTRHFSPPGDIHSVQDIATSLSEKHGIPLSEVETIISPVLEVETHILQNLNIPEETLRFYFGSARGCWASLGFALYSMQQKHIQFSQLPQDRRLPALRYLISRILECPAEELESIEDLHSLLHFLRGYPRIEHYKYACLQAFSDPEACQAELAQIIEQAASLFREMEAPFLSRIPSAIQSFQTNPDPGILHLLEFVPEKSPIVWIPTLVPIGSIALYESSESTSYLYYGVFFDAIHALNQKYSQDVNRLSRGLKALSDTRRLSILQELKNQPLYGQDIGDRLKLSPATVSYHMANLLYENFVVAEKQGIYTQYSISRSNLQAFFQSLQNSLL